MIFKDYSKQPYRVPFMGPFRKTYSFTQSLLSGLLLVMAISLIRLTEINFSLTILPVMIFDYMTLGIHEITMVRPTFYLSCYVITEAVDGPDIVRLFFTLGTFVKCIEEPWFYHFICDLFTPGFLELKSGEFILSSYPKVVVDLTLARNNMCAWNVLFVDPEDAQLRLSDRIDGKMSATLINKLMNDGMVNVYDRMGLLKGSRCDHEFTIYINGAHAIAEVPKNIYEKSSILSYYSGPPVGLLLPRSPPKVNRMLPVRLAVEDKLKQLLPLIEEGRKGRIAECGYIALREEHDVIEELCTKPSMQELSEPEIMRLYLSNEKWKIYDNHENKWLNGVSRGSSNAFKAKRNEEGMISQLMWNGEDFVFGQFSYRNKPFFTRNPESDSGKAKGRYFLLMEDLPYRRGTHYADRALQLLDSDHNVDVILEEGVPSCGKTTDICDRSTFMDFICLPSREGAEEYCERGKQARTIDSVVVNGFTRGAPVRTLWIDEGLLAHCGAIEMMIQIIQPEICRVYGDRNQLPYIVRVANYKLVNKGYPWTGEPVYHDEAYKNPKVVCDVLRPLYPRGYVWANDTYGSLHLYNINSIEGVRPGYTMYLTYTQNSKAELKRRFKGARVMTINESQGLRSEHVCLVRLSIFDTEIYKDRAQNIVAISRSSKTFSYYTVKRNDTMSKWLDGKTAFGDAPLEGEKEFNCLPYKHYGGANTCVTDQVIKLNTVDDNLEYNDWRSMLNRVGDIFAPQCLPFMIRKVITPFREWYDQPPRKPEPVEIQATMDTMYHRIDRDVAIGERLDFPGEWPEGCKIDIVKSAKRPALEPRPAIHPIVETPHYDRAFNHPKDVAVAMGKRVAGVVRQKLNYNVGLVDELIDGVMRCGDKHKIDTLNDSIPTNCGEMKKLWWFTRPGNKRSQIRSTEVEKTNGSRYYCIVKSDHKPQLEGNHIDGIPAGQLVTASDPFWSSVFAPIFQSILIKFLQFLKPNIIFATRMTWEEIDGVLDNLMSERIFKILELDISKFDKSQDATLLEAQCRIFKMFGMEDWAIDLWIAFHELCKLTFPKWGAKFTVGFQRRSGDALTWFGNTLVLLMILAYLYPIEDAIFSILGGDDNTTGWPLNIPIMDCSKRAGEILNFEIKPLSFNNSMYFSSRFILLTRNGWVTVPDPVKSVIRLCRRDLQGEEHLEAIHDSMKCLHYKYLDIEVRNLLDEAAVSRYNGTLSMEIKTLMPFINMIAAVLSDFKYFKTFYTGSRKEWALKLDPHEVIGGGLYEKLLDVYTDDF